MICKNEGIKLESDDVLDLLIQVTEGDLRRSINTLQTCSSFVKVSSDSNSTGVLKKEDIEKISGLVPDTIVELIYNTIQKTSNYSEIQDLAQNLILEGYDIQQLLTKLQSHYSQRSTNEVADLQKAKISEIVAESDYKMIQGGDEELNLLYVLSGVARIIHN